MPVTADSAVTVVTFVRPTLDARPNEDADRIYVTHEPLDPGYHPVWDLAGFPFLYEIAGEFDEDGRLSSLQPDCAFLREFLAQIEPGGHMGFKLPSKSLNELVGAMARHIAQPDGDSAATFSVTDGDARYLASATELEDNPGSYRLSIWNDATLPVWPLEVLRMTRDQACRTLERFTLTSRPATRPRG